MEALFGDKRCMVTSGGGIIDIKVIDTDAPSHCNRSPESVLESGAKEKKRMYEQAVAEWRGCMSRLWLSGGDV